MELMEGDLDATWDPEKNNWCAFSWGYSWVSSYPFAVSQRTLYMYI